MKILVATAAWWVAVCLSLGCAPAPSRPGPVATPVRVQNHNENAVDVLLICAWTLNGVWLGTIDGKTSDTLAIPAGQPGCAEGRRFYLVVQDAGRGYWVDPVRPEQGEAVQLVIDEYAGRSTARVRSANMADLRRK